MEGTCGPVMRKQAAANGYQIQCIENSDNRHFVHIRWPKSVTWRVKCKMLVAWLATRQVEARCIIHDNTVISAENSSPVAENLHAATKSPLDPKGTPSR